MSRLQPVVAAAVAQVADINKNMFTHKYQSALSLPVIDFTRMGGMVNWWHRIWQLSTPKATNYNMSLKSVRLCERSMLMP